MYLNAYYIFSQIARMGGAIPVSNTPPFLVNVPNLPCASFAEFLQSADMLSVAVYQLCLGDNYVINNWCCFLHARSYMCTYKWQFYGGLGGAGAPPNLSLPRPLVYAWMVQNFVNSE